MDIHINTLLTVVVVAAVCRAVHGFRVGMTEELSALGNIFAGVLMLILLVLTYASFRDNDTIGLLLDIILLLVVSLTYKILKGVLSPAKFLAKLPLVKQADQLCGMLFGILETIVILWALESVVYTFGLGAFGAWILKNVEDSVVLTLLFRYNLITMAIPFLLSKFLSAVNR